MLSKIWDTPNPQPLDNLWTRHFSKEEKIGTVDILDVHVRDTRRFKNIHDIGSSKGFREKK